MTISGNVVSYEIGLKGDSTATTVILEVAFSDPDDIRPVEWIPAPGEDSAPLTGSRVIVHELSSGYLVAIGGNDGAVPVSDEGGKEIYSAIKDSSTVKKMARIRCLPNGDVEIITEKDLIATIAGDTTINSIGDVDLTAPNFNITADVNIVGDVDIIGDQTNDGTIDATGNISTEGDVSADGDTISDAAATAISGKGHAHTDSLGGPTTPPVAGGSPPPAPIPFDTHSHAQGSDSNGDAEVDVGPPK